MRLGQSGAAFGVAVLLHVTGVIDMSYFLGINDATYFAQRYVSIKKVNIILEKEEAQRIAGGNYLVPLRLSGKITNDSNKEFKEVKIEWSYQFIGTEAKGIVILDNVLADDVISVEGDTIGNIELPGDQLGGKWHSEIAIIKAEFLDKDKNNSRKLIF